MAGSFTAKNVALPPVSGSIEDSAVQSQFTKLNQAIQSLFGQYVAELTNLIPVSYVATSGQSSFSVPAGPSFTYVAAAASPTVGMTVNLPSAPAVGNQVVVKKKDGYQPSITIQPAGAATIDGRANWKLTTPLSWVWLIYEATNVWSVI